MAVQFSIVFQILVAVEGFSVWKGKSFIGKSVAGFDDGPKFDNKKFSELCKQLADFPNLGKTIWKIVVMFLGFKIARFNYSFASKSKSIFMSLIKLLYNTIGFFLKCSPIISVPLLAVCYLKQWGCDGDNISPSVMRWVYWFIVAKIALYIFCAIINKIIVRNVRVKTNVPELLDISRIP